jgi:hypothetical protein
MARHLQNIYISFMFNLGDMSISEYFQILHYTFTLVKKSDVEFIFNIYREKMRNYSFPQLPFELSAYISNYLYERIDITYLLVYPPTFPFRPPIWSLLHDKSNNMHNYAYVSHFINKQYEMDWSPSITIEKTVLNLIECFLTLKN